MMNKISSHSSLLTDGAERDSKCNNRIERCPVVKVEGVRLELSVTQQEVNFTMVRLLFIFVFSTLHELEVSSRCLAYSTEEIQGVAASVCIVLWSYVFKAYSSILLVR